MKKPRPRNMKQPQTSQPATVRCLDCAHPQLYRSSPQDPVIAICHAIPNPTPSFGGPWQRFPAAHPRRCACHTPSAHPIPVIPHSI